MKMSMFVFPRSLVAVGVATLAVAMAMPAFADQMSTMENRIKALDQALNSTKAQLKALEAKVTALQASDAVQTAQLSELAEAVLALEGTLANSCPPDQTPACCPAGFGFCGNGCFDLATDPAHCGDCDTACPEGFQCTSGTCVLSCSASAGCGMAGDSCQNGMCLCGNGPACTSGVCIDGACLPCGNGVLEAGEQCDDGNLSDGDGCTAQCAIEECAPDVVFAVGVFGTTTCAQNCAAVGGLCMGIGTDDLATNGQYYECGQASSGIGTTLAPGTCSTVLGGQGCSEYTQCRCAPAYEESTVFAVGVFGTTTCQNNCAAVGATCVGIGTNEQATNGMYYECGQATSGIGTTQVQGSCATVLGGQGCSEYTTCRCRTPDPDCTGTVFAVGVFGTTTCQNNCAAQGGTCVGIGTNDAATNGLYYECGQATSGIGTTQVAGSCTTVLGGQGCSEYTSCLCYFQ